MPIYAYRCDACGFAKDALQKISDAPLTVCPECGKAEFKKQVTAAGFQLKGSGWYVTDFRNGGSGGGAPKTDGSASSASSAAASTAAASSDSSSASTATPPAPAATSN